MKLQRNKAKEVKFTGILVFLGVFAFFATAGAEGLTIDQHSTYNPSTGNITYNLNWNVSTSTVQNVAIVNSIPVGTTYVSANGGGMASGSAVTWNLGNKNFGDAGSVSFSTSLDAAKALAIDSILLPNIELSVLPDGNLSVPTSTADSFPYYLLPLSCSIQNHVTISGEVQGLSVSSTASSLLDVHPGCHSSFSGSGIEGSGPSGGSTSSPSQTGVGGDQGGFSGSPSGGSGGSGAGVPQVLGTNTGSGGASENDPPEGQGGYDEPQVLGIATELPRTGTEPAVFFLLGGVLLLGLVIYSAKNITFIELN
jgi:LPXTG-motif cell wall-anchored protein